MLLFVCLQDLKKKEGGGNGKAEELTDGTATKAGKHKLVIQMLSLCMCPTLGEDIFLNGCMNTRAFSISSALPFFASSAGSLLCFPTK